MLGASAEVDYLKKRECYGLKVDSVVTVPSRTLKVIVPTDREKLERIGPIHSLDPTRIAYYDLRDATAAKKEMRMDYLNDFTSRSLDEEGRVVVLVEEHLKEEEVSCIFSVYGAIRAIQAMAGTSIHRIIEFYDLRSAQKAVEACNAVDIDGVSAATVTYLEKTRSKIFPVPPRLPEKPLTMTSRFFDSSSSLIGYPENKGQSGGLSSNGSSNALSVKEVLPSGLGLYDDEETIEPSQVEGTSSNYDSFRPFSFDYLSPGIPLIPKSPIALPEDTSFLNSMRQQDAFVISHYIQCLEQARYFQQAVQLEVMRRLTSLKCCDSVQLEESKSDRNRKKTNARFQKSTAELELEAEKKAQQERMFALDLDLVRSGKETRTTLMIKNIPNKYTQKMLLSRIEEDFKGMFDFFYLPIDFKNKCNVGYGFINMTSVKDIVKFVEHVHEQKWDKFNSDKVCCVTFARIQGRQALINHFQNSSLMLEESKHQPLLFSPEGEPEPFPIKV